MNPEQSNNVSILPERPHWFMYVVTMFLGVVTGFVAVVGTVLLGSLFTDLTGSLVMASLLCGVIVVPLSYAAFAFPFGYRWPVLGWKWGLWFAVPFTLYFLTQSIPSSINLYSEQTRMLIYSIGGVTLVALIGMVLPACVGAHAGGRMKRKRVTYSGAAEQIVEPERGEHVSQLD